MKGQELLSSRMASRSTQPQPLQSLEPLLGEILKKLQLIEQALAEVNGKLGSGQTKASAASSDELGLSARPS